MIRLYYGQPNDFDRGWTIESLWKPHTKNGRFGGWPPALWAKVIICYVYTYKYGTNRTSECYSIPAFYYTDTISLISKYFNSIFQSTGGDKLTFHCHIKGKCHEEKWKTIYTIWLTICFMQTCIISCIIDELQSHVICDLYLIFNSNLLSSNIKGHINEQYMDFRQNIKIYQPQIPNPKYFPQIPNPK